VNEQSERAALESERRELLQRLEDWLETPMIIFGFIWLAILVVELIAGTSPFLEVLATVIWIIFVIDFLVRLVLAPEKVAYLKRNWLTIPALAVPALRVFRIARVVRILSVTRAARGMRLFRVVSSLNRGSRALARTMRRRGLGYALALTVIVVVAGAAGMYAFEQDASGGGYFATFGSSLWWTAMVMTTMGADTFPVTAEGRLLCLLLALYAFVVFGYATASLATFFLARDAEDDAGELASARAVALLTAELQMLRAELRAAREPGPAT